MTQDKTEHHVAFASTILLVLFVGLTLFVVSIVRASPGPDRSAPCATVKTAAALRLEKV